MHVTTSPIVGHNAIGVYRIGSCNFDRPKKLSWYSYEDFSGEPAVAVRLLFVFLRELRPHLPSKRDLSSTRNADAILDYFRVISRVNTLATTRAFCTRLSITCCSLLLSPYCFMRRSRTFCARPSRAAKFL